MAETLANPFAEDVARLQEAIERAQHVTLEIGTGLYPLPSLPGNKYDEHNLYIGWNIAPYSHRALMREYVNEHRFAVYTPLIDSKTVLEMIPAESIDTAVMANVFGEPYIDHRFRNTSKTGDKLDTLDIARDLLIPHGEIVIIETITPELAIPFRTRNHATKTLEAAGFTEVSFLPEESQGFKAEMRRFNHFNEVSHGQSFMVTAHKY